jgi:hypothetical protein
MVASQTNVQTPFSRWGVEVKGAKDDLEIRYTRNGEPIYTVNVVNMIGGVIYEFIDYTKYAGVIPSQSIINPWERSYADIIITIDRGDWLNKICDAYAHFPGLTLYTMSAVGNVVVKLGGNIYCARLPNAKRIRLLNYMLSAISHSMHYDAFLLKHEVQWVYDKLGKYYNAMEALNKLGIRDVEHLKAIERAIFA